MEDILINIAEQYDIDDIAGVDISFNKTAGIIKFNSDDMYREAIDTMETAGAAIGGLTVYKYLKKHPEKKEAIKKLITEKGLKYKDMLQQPISSLMKRIPALSTALETAATAANTAVDAAKGTIPTTNVPTPKGTTVPTPKVPKVVDPTKGLRGLATKGLSKIPKGLPKGVGVGLLGAGLDYAGQQVGGTAGNVMQTAGKGIEIGSTAATITGLLGSRLPFLAAGPVGWVVGGIGALAWALGSDPDMRGIVEKWVDLETKGTADEAARKQFVDTTMAAIGTGANKMAEQWEAQLKKQQGKQPTASTLDELLKIAADLGASEAAGTTPTAPEDTLDIDIGEGGVDIDKDPVTKSLVDNISDFGSEVADNAMFKLKGIFGHHNALELETKIADLLISKKQLAPQYKDQFIGYLTDFANQGFASLEQASAKKKEEKAAGGTTSDQTKATTDQTAKTPDQTAKTPDQTVATGKLREAPVTQERLKKLRDQGFSEEQINQTFKDEAILEQGKIPGQGKSIKPERSVIDPIIGKKPATTDKIQYERADGRTPKTPSIMTGFQGDPKLTTDPNVLKQQNKWNPSAGSEFKTNQPTQEDIRNSVDNPTNAVPAVYLRNDPNNPNNPNNPANPKNQPNYAPPIAASYVGERDKYGFPVGAIAITILKYGPEVYAVYKALKEIIFGNEQSGADEEKDIAATIAGDIIKEGSFLDALSIAEKVFNAAKTIVEESPEANKLVKQLMEKTGKNPKEVIGSVQNIIKALDEFLNTVKDDQSLEKKSSVTPVEYLQVNSGTFVIRKGSTYYNELESILNKFAEEHTINNVSEIELEFSNKTGEVTFKKAVEFSPTTAIVSTLIRRYFPGQSESWITTMIGSAAAGLTNTGVTIGSLAAKALGFDEVGQIVGGALGAGAWRLIFGPSETKEDSQAKQQLLGTSYEDATANPSLAEIIKTKSEKDGTTPQQAWISITNDLVSSGAIEQIMSAKKG